MLDATTVDQIVANVLKQLSTRGTSAPVRVANDAKQELVQENAGRVDSSASAIATQAQATHLSERVITGDLLAEKAAGARQIVIPDKAILTPTANDFLKAHRVHVVRGAQSTPVRVGDAAITSWKLVIVTSTSAVSRLAGELTSGWNREILGCPDDAAALAISAICRGDAGGVVILSNKHFRAACRANRNDKVRAVPVGCPAEIKAAREQLRLNVIAIDPTNRSYFELKNIVGAFTAPSK